MNNETFTNAVKNIKMPYDMKRRIENNCINKTEEIAMKKNTFFKRPIIAIAIIILCVAIASVSVFASSGKRQGYFRDIKNLGGAITNTAYEEATDEIEVNITDVSDELTLKITLLNIDKPPYNCSESFGINSYSIVDATGKTVVNNQSSSQTDVVDNTVLIDIPVSNLHSGTYTLIIDEFISSKKADQPLILGGNWKINFTK